MSTEARIPGLTLRPATPRDADFLFALKRTTLGEYIARTWGEWDDAWQRAHFDGQFEASGVRIVQLDGEDIGMISVREEEDALFLELIDILPEHQGRGIGSFLIRRVMARARDRGVPTRLQVLRVNPARRLYERLGFRVVKESETHYTMETALSRGVRVEEPVNGSLANRGIAMEIAETIISQYGAALRMLRSAIEACPDDLWETESYKNRFWHIAYHALFYTHLYLGASESAFVPWEKSRPMYQFMGPLPWAPHEEPKIGEPYTRSTILEYWEWLGERVAPQVREVPFDDPSGFPWLPFGRFELHLYNIRHIQHHAGQLIERLRGEGVTDFGWVRTGEEEA